VSKRCGLRPDSMTTTIFGCRFRPAAPAGSHACGRPLGEGSGGQRWHAASCPRGCSEGVPPGRAEGAGACHSARRARMVGIRPHSPGCGLWSRRGTGSSVEGDGAAGQSTGGLLGVTPGGPRGGGILWGGAGTSWGDGGASSGGGGASWGGRGSL